VPNIAQHAIRIHTGHAGQFGYNNTAVYRKASGAFFNVSSSFVVVRFKPPYLGTETVHRGVKDLVFSTLPQFLRHKLIYAEKPTWWILTVRGWPSRFQPWRQQTESGVSDVTCVINYVDGLRPSEIGPVDSGRWTHRGKVPNNDHFRSAAATVENT